MNKTPTLALTIRPLGQSNLQDFVLKRRQRLLLNSTSNTQGVDGYQVVSIIRAQWMGEGSWVRWKDGSPWAPALKIKQNRVSVRLSIIYKGITLARGPGHPRIP